MRHSIPFDTHAFVKELTAAVHARALAEIALANLATKDDLKAMEGRIEARFAGMEARFAAVDARFAERELRLTLRLGTMMAAAVGITVALVKLL